jgi:hypothetical protein
LRVDSFPATEYVTICPHWKGEVTSQRKRMFFKLSLMPTDTSRPLIPGEATEKRGRGPSFQRNSGRVKTIQRLMFPSCIFPCLYVMVIIKPWPILKLTVGSMHCWQLISNSKEQLEEISKI